MNKGKTPIEQDPLEQIRNKAEARSESSTPLSRDQKDIQILLTEIERLEAIVSDLEEYKSDKENSCHHYGGNKLSDYGCGKCVFGD